MALKYYIEYDDTESVTHLFEIYDDNYNGTAIEVYGYVTLDMASITSPLEAIKGSGLRVELEADSNLTFSDLYSEEQRTLPVIYTRDSVVKFRGFLNPENWYENLVSDKWNVSFDCVDGLGFLSSLSYVDVNGLPYLGKDTLLNVIAKCLLRTGVEANINTDIDIYYTGLATNVNVLANVYTIQERFIKDDGATIMSCEEVLRSILEPFTACLTMIDGEWYIYKPSQLTDNTGSTHYRYSYLGVALAPTTGFKEFYKILGSQINGYYPHYCNGNQSLSFKNSIGAYRISYKYGLVKSFITNPYFYSADGTTISEWTINDNTYMTLDAGDVGVTFDIQDVASTVALTSVNVSLNLGVLVQFILRFQTLQSEYFDMTFRYQIKLDDTGSADNYYLNSAGAWIKNVSTTYIENVLDRSLIAFDEFAHIIDAEALPVTGNVTMMAYNPIKNGGSNFAKHIELVEMSVTNTSDDLGIIKGEFHTLQRTTKPSTKIERLKTVTIGDNSTDLYLGTLYKSDLDTPTESWFRNGFTEALPILGLMGMETLRASSTPIKVVSGDLYGYFEAADIFNLRIVDGFYIAISYSYNTKTNITSCVFQQITGFELTDVDYRITTDYGNTTKPTIKG